jgi:GH24 family phage-related lysozyme (muramidase)
VVDGKALTPEAQRAVSGAAKEQYQRELSKQYETRQSSNNGRKLPNYAINDLGGYADDGIDERYQLYYQLEGERSLDAYPPPSKTSGVTVYGGIDLGQQDPEVLAKELPKSLFLKIQPYLGKKGKAAEVALSIRPLRLSQDEATALEKAVLGKQRERINSVFREVAGREIAELPIQAQQVLYSLEHNIYGIEKKMPDFFQAMAKGNIQKAYNALRKRVKSETLPGLRNRRLQELQVLGELLPDTPIKQVAENSGVEYLPDGTAKVSYG